MQRSAYDIKGKKEYKNIIVEIRARINQITGYQSYLGESMQRLKADKIQEYLRKIDPDVLNVLAHDDDHKDLQKYVLPVVEENLKRYIEGKKITRPSETVGSETTAKQTSRLESVRESLKFNLQVLLPALAILKGGDKKALFSFLEKQSEADLDRLENMKPKGLVTKKIAEEFKNAVVVNKVSRLIEEICNVGEKFEQQQINKSGEGALKPLQDQVNALDNKIASFRESHPKQVEEALKILSDKYKKMPAGPQADAKSISFRLDVLKNQGGFLRDHLAIKNQAQQLVKK